MRPPGARAPRPPDATSSCPAARDDGWTVVKVAIPPPLDQLGTEVRADERPEVAEDPRSSQQQNVPWPGV